MEPDDTLLVFVVGRAGELVSESRVSIDERSALAVMSALCRSQLTLRRHGLHLEVEAPAGWRAFFDGCGFDDVLPPPGSRSVVEVLGETEDREQLRVEEVVVSDDPVA